MGCVVGFVAETAVFYLKYGYIENRQGLLYGPFSQVYGFGAVWLVIFLNRLAGKKIIWIFLAGALIGCGFEVISSLIQEAVFSSVSWDYSAQRFPLFGGRTSLLMMFYWGVLSVLFMKLVYPPMLHIIDRIPQKPGHIISWIIAVFFALNLSISALAVHRWSERMEGIPPENPMDVYLDQHFPNDEMRAVYTNLVFRSKAKNR